MLINLTLKRKTHFCESILSRVETPIGFADVGSGGELKFPWNVIPVEKLHKFDFDPEELRGDAGKPPICISDQRGESVFFVARDPRSSSLHPASIDFVTRYGQTELLTKDETQVFCETLDHVFSGRFDEVDLLDINVEGHDYQVLQGASQLFFEGFIKCVKVEFELTEVWKGQGWFGDIDSSLRNRGYELASMEVEYGRPVNALSIYHRGEPLWGKAIYVPGKAIWENRYLALKQGGFKESAFKAIVLYTLLDLPGRALDLLDFIQDKQIVSISEKVKFEAALISVFRYAKLDARMGKIFENIPFLSRLLR